MLRLCCPKSRPLWCGRCGGWWSRRSTTGTPVSWQPTTIRASTPSNKPPYRPQNGCSSSRNWHAGRATLAPPSANASWPGSGRRGMRGYDHAGHGSHAPWTIPAAHHSRLPIGLPAGSARGTPHYGGFWHARSGLGTPQLAISLSLSLRKVRGTVAVRAQAVFEIVSRASQQTFHNRSDEMGQTISNPISRTDLCRTQNVASPSSRFLSE